jgi:hypothetical protein
VSYRATLIGRALSQFRDLIGDQDAYEALVERILQLGESPWDAWSVPAAGDEPAHRQAEFGEHGLLSFRVDDQAETLTIFSIVWTGEGWPHTPRANRGLGDGRRRAVRARSV